MGVGGEGKVEGDGIETFAFTVLSGQEGLKLRSTAYYTFRPQSNLPTAIPTQVHHFQLKGNKSRNINIRLHIQLPKDPSNGVTAPATTKVWQREMSQMKYH